MKRITTFFTLMALALFFANSTFAQCSIAGSSSIPLGQNRTYSVTTQSGASYFWSTTGGLSIVGSNTSSSVTVQGNSNGVLYVTRFRSGSAPCCQSRSISVANGCPTSASINRFVECLGNQAIVDLSANVTPSGTAGAATYSWTKLSGPGNFIGGTTSQFATLLVPDNSSVRVRLTVTCLGNTITRELTIRIPDCGGIILRQLSKISPNPASSSVKVELPNSSTQVRNYEIEVINKLGEVVMRKKMLSSQSDLDITKLKEGMYFVRTKLGGKVIGSTRLLKK